ncbi:signal transduction histidine kinase [Deinobacterium chartae]|uniref:histidine kinase n=1 Tax=Deinobacterium chartae TaxID=521158 RepID=A0A841HZW2_9DEIO|nr:HAMP domain-containing sensor histidine kinase [Deinobacterium chartae]MBB6098937.1 signal transduction histidine kinase [Deinobacterium chartae]
MRPTLSLRTRIVVLVSVLLLGTAVIGGSSMYVALLLKLNQRERVQLEQDAAQLAQLYAGNQVGGDTVTGGARVEFYRHDGERVKGGPQAPLPAAEVRAARLAPRTLEINIDGSLTLAALRTVELGAASSPLILAVRRDVSYIQQTGRELLGILGLTTALVLLVALPAVYLVTRIGLEPLIDVAQQARRIDERRLTPVQYQGPEDELGLLVKALNRTVARLGSALQAQRVFLAETSHELRTPLTALEGYLRRALREADEQHKPPLEDAERVAQSMTRLVNDLLQLSRGELVQDFTPHYVDIEGQLRQLSRENPGVTCQVHGDLSLLGDPERLMQVWRNLVSNALRASGDPHMVRLEGRRADGHLVVEVIDRGPGIPEPDRERIFEKFYKGASKGGAGLGLTIARQIVEAHRGQITVHETPGGGATFRVTLPALEEEEETELPEAMA